MPQEIIGIREFCKTIGEESNNNSTKLTFISLGPTMSFSNVLYNSLDKLYNIKAKVFHQKFILNEVENKLKGEKVIIVIESGVESFNDKKKRKFRKLLARVEELKGELIAIVCNSNFDVRSLTESKVKYIYKMEETVTDFLQNANPYAEPSFMDDPRFLNKKEKQDYLFKKRQLEELNAAFRRM